jgi:AraC family transcriptional regulator
VTDQLLAIDFTQEASLLKVLPRSPICSSQSAEWLGICLHHHLQPAHETPEYYTGWHQISIHIGPPALIYQWLENGQLKQKYAVPGDVEIIPAKNYQRFRWHQELEFIDLYLEPGLLNRSFQGSVELDRVELVPQFLARDPLIHQIGLALKAELELGGSRLYAETMASALAAHLLRRYSVQPRSIPSDSSRLTRQQLQAAIAYIHEHLSADLSLSELAAVVNLSPHYFASLFKRSTGKPPHQYVLEQRIASAKQLLIQPEHEIIDISQQVGFRNQSHFTRVFRQQTGVTPKVYRTLL